MRFRLLLCLFQSLTLAVTAAYADPPSPPLSRQAQMYWDALMETPPRFGSDILDLAFSGGVGSTFGDTGPQRSEAAFQEFLNHPQVQARIQQGIQARERMRPELQQNAREQIARLNQILGVDIDFAAWARARIDQFMRQSRSSRNYTQSQAESEARQRLSAQLGREPILEAGSSDLLEYQRLVNRVLLEENPLTRRGPSQTQIRRL